MLTDQAGLTDEARADDDPILPYTIVFAAGEPGPARTLDDAIAAAINATAHGRSAVFIERGPEVVLGGAELRDAIAQRVW
jgi:hypothetical protein